MRLLPLCLLLCVACASTPPPPGGGETWPSLSTDAEIASHLPQLSNWGRWGKDDVRGTLNLITPQEVRAARELVRKGLTVSLARSVSMARTEGMREPHYEMRKDTLASRDVVDALWHGFAQTHVDALCHAFATETELYNGVPTTDVGPQGCANLGVDALAREGVVGRGVRLDIAALRGRALEPGEAVRIRDLEAAAAAQRVELRPGDLVAVRTGAGRRNGRERRAGLHPECLSWVKAKGVAVLLSDGDSDVAPFEGLERYASPFHSVGIPYLGLPLVDGAELDALAAVAQRLQRHTFLLVLAPWRLEGTTSAPVNPIAIF
jgi:kynurenine formamidase